ncbi:MAG: tRNA uridine-5-carboxymethylaminomethyl(34) synthesis GTPase MnmE [Lachnospiraceae bacterium]|nr:tRNA uridine-5-carboxymethylaminomethyl(34) synthesis GTPase MnmE [Lachnospiraceae bacterium]
MVTSGGFSPDMVSPQSDGRQDTIAAIATAQAPAGIGIIRVSGTRAHDILNEVFRNARGECVVQSLSAGVLRHGYACDAGGLRLDEVMAVRMDRPHSYTGEDMAELQCHGGLFVLRRVLDAVLQAGARLAEPGEFTKRAFLNGRIDLTQAEAVMDVISAENDFALKNAGRQIDGALRSRIESLRQKLLHESAFIEAALDDPESYEDALNDYAPRLTETLRFVSADIEEMLRHAQEGILLREGVRCAIIGIPNAGKSSLLNLLAGTERAIVSQIPGTTRDTVEERVRVGSLTLRLIDTAGIGDGSGRELDPVEKIGMERARAALEDAELILFVVDVSGAIDREVIDLYRETDGKRRIVIANQIDRLPEQGRSVRDVAASLPVEFEGTDAVWISAKTGEGLSDLRLAIEKSLLQDDSWRGEDLLITHERHRLLLQEAQESLSALSATIGRGMSEDFYTVDLMGAYEALGRIIGAQTDDDLADEIFSKFCMGK